MPRKPIDYSKCIIYHFICKDVAITDTYVGHTVNFRTRKNSNESRCYNDKSKEYNLNTYKNIRANGGWSNWEMMPLEEYPCDNNIQARIREQYWIDKLQAKMNSVNAYTDRQEYEKQYHKENKDYIAERTKKNSEEHI